MGRGLQINQQIISEHRPSSPGAPLPVLAVAGLSAITAHAQSAAPGTSAARPRSAPGLRHRLRGLPPGARSRSPPRSSLQGPLRAHARSRPQSRHVDRGRVLRQSGDFSGAFNEFTRALRSIPATRPPSRRSTTSARSSSRGRIAPRTPARPAAEQMSRQDGIARRDRLHRRPHRAQAVLQRPHHAAHGRGRQGHLSGHRQGRRPQRPLRPRLHLQAHSRRPHQRHLSDALRIVGTISGTFYKPVTANTIFVAQNTRTKRTDLDEQAVQTFYLTNCQPAERRQRSRSSPSATCSTPASRSTSFPARTPSSCAPRPTSSCLRKS